MNLFVCDGIFTKMTYFPANKYVLVKFKRSAREGKKYDAVLRNKETGREVVVSFGATGYEQYKDHVLGLFKGSDHGDTKRRASYRARHAGEGDASRKFSPGWFAWHMLW